MAQNLIQRYVSDQAFYDSARAPLEVWYKNYQALEKMDNFLSSATPTDYPGITDKTLTDFGTLKTELSAYLASPDVADFLAEVKKFIKI